MKTVNTILEVRSAVAGARRAGEVIGLVPTMGALHRGHFSLIDRARAECGFVVVSIFVNPTQFGPQEDLAAYPRTPEQDLAGCREHGADLVFLPGIREMYPRPGAATVSVAKLAGALCGRSRPTHFPGVCTVVAKLFHIVLPDKAYFGAKDFQQAVIIRRMAEDLDFPVEVITCPTVREPDGLALSSRNAYLTPAERKQASALSGALRLAEGMIRDRRPTATEVIDAIRRHISARAPDGKIDYAQIVDPTELTDVVRTDSPVLIALAVKFGKARLIDNVLVDAEAPKP